MTMVDLGAGALGGVGATALNVFGTGGVVVVWPLGSVIPGEEQMVEPTCVGVAVVVEPPPPVDG